MSEFKIGDRVVCTVFGEGTVDEVKGGMVYVKFDNTPVERDNRPEAFSGSDVSVADLYFTPSIICNSSTLKKL